MNIFGISIDDLSQEQVLHTVENSIKQGVSFRISTVNPEFLLIAKNNPEFSKSLQNAHIRVRDGFGIAFAYWIRGKHAPSRITGADLVNMFLEIANTNQWGIFILNNKEGLSSFQEIKNAINMRYPKISIFGFDISLLDLDSPLFSSLASQEIFSSLPCHLPLVTSHCIFSSLGAPQQELLLNELQKKDIPALLMGVGGSFDFLTGKQKRAPKWMRYLGLEWLFRLVTHPNRIRRIFRAVVIFPFLLILALYSKER